MSRDSMAFRIKVFLLLVGFLAFLYKGLIWDDRSKFVVNDCVALIYTREFEQKIYFHKIIRVGKKEYLTSISLGEGYRPFNRRSVWKFILNKHEKVDRKNCNVGIVVGE